MVEELVAWRCVQCLEGSSGLTCRASQRFQGLEGGGWGFKGLGFRGLGFRGLGFKGLGFRVYIGLLKEAAACTRGFRVECVSTQVSQLLERLAGGEAGDGFGGLGVLYPLPFVLLQGSFFKVTNPPKWVPLLKYGYWATE